MRLLHTMIRVGDLNRSIDFYTNILGMTKVAQEFMSKLIETSGHIVNISSISGCMPYPGGHVYGGTKAYTNQFSNNLRIDLLGTGVRVTDIAP